MRSAYRMRIVDGMDVHGKDRIWVLKLSKDPKEPTRQYYKDVEMQMEAKKWATQFNKTGTPKQVDFIAAQVVILIDRPAKPTCTMEKYVEGEYVKYNDNWAWCDDKRNTPQAFSHYTWEASRNTLLVCDLQGVGDCWTDPQIHTIDGRGFGKGNAGLQGIRQFLSKHKCNGICRALKLPSVSGQQKVNDFGTQWGAAIRQKQQQQKQQQKQQRRNLPPPPPADRRQPVEKEAPAAPVGVGITIDGGAADGILLPLIVVSVKAASPAAISGKVQRGDFIVQVGDVPVQGATVAECKKLILGTPGTEVILHLQRGIKVHSARLLRAPGQQHPSTRKRKQEYHEAAQAALNGKGKDTDCMTVAAERPAKQARPPAAPVTDKENAHENKTPAVDVTGGKAAPNMRPRVPPVQGNVAGMPRMPGQGYGAFVI